MSGLTQKQRAHVLKRLRYARMARELDEELTTLWPVGTLVQQDGYGSLVFVVEGVRRGYIRLRRRDTGTTHYASPSSLTVPL